MPEIDIEKENKAIEEKLKQACSSILAKKNIEPKKCLSLMKEQISTNASVGIPDYTASDIYIKISEAIPKQLNVTFTELDVSEKKVRISAEVPGFEMVDQVEASSKNVPCFKNIEKGRAQQVGNIVKFTLSADVDCSPALSKPPK